MTPERTVRVLVLTSTGGLWKKTIAGNIEAFAEIIGGWVEMIALAPGVAVFIDAEARSRNKFLNWNASTIIRDHIPGYSDVVAGDVIVCGIDARGTPKDVPDRFSTSIGRVDPATSGEPPYQGRHSDG